MAEYRNNSRIPEERNTTEARTRGLAWHFSLPSIFIRVQSYQSDKQVAKRILLKLLLEENYMKMRILLPFWPLITTVALLTSRCSWKDSWKQLALAGRKWSMNEYDAMEANEGTISNIKKPGMKQWVLTSLMKFVVSSSLRLLRYILSFSHLKYQQRLQKENMSIFTKFHESSLSWNVD